MNKIDRNIIKYPDETWDVLNYIDENDKRDFIDILQAESTDGIEDVFLKTGCIQEAKGSCYVEIGHTKVICSLYGPREIVRRDDFSFKLANLNCEFRYATFASPYYQRRTGTLTTSAGLYQQQTQKQKNFLNQTISRSIEEALKPSILLHKYPKSQIEIYIVCIQSDLKTFNFNKVLSASIIAASMSLVDASIECYDLVSSYSDNLNNLTVSYMPSLHQITSIYYAGEQTMNPVSIDLYKSYIKDSIENCKKIYTLMKYVLVNKVKQSDKNFIDEDVGDDNEENYEDTNIDLKKMSLNK